MNKEKSVMPAVSRKFVLKDDIRMDVSKYQGHSGRDTGRHCVGAAGSTGSGCRERPLSSIRVLGPAMYFSNINHEKKHPPLKSFFILIN